MISLNEGQPKQEQLFPFHHKSLIQKQIARPVQVQHKLLDTGRKTIKYFKTI